jgi:hypothetical protein
MRQNLEIKSRRIIEHRGGGSFLQADNSGEERPSFFIDLCQLVNGCES